ncbi:hypothetical protein M3Y99_01911500 [Aphelenchoides fujianensis]|nr:hypothetical protein M3Y99_01911500 [Aphelenchoides fujianensis]
MEEQLQERYEHLLQPLRDVEANWDGSIQEYLREYLDKLKADRERNLVAENGQVIKFDFSMAAMLLQGSLRIFGLKVDHLHEEICKLYASNKPKKKGEWTLRSTQHRFFQVQIKQMSEMLKEMVGVQSLLAQNDKRRENVKPSRPGRICERNCREHLVPLPISFIPNKKASPSVHYIQHVQNNEPTYVSQSEFFSLNSAAFPFALLDQQAEPVVRGHTVSGKTRGDAEVAVLLNIAYKDALFEFSNDLSVGGRGRAPRSQTANERRMLDLIEEEPGEYEEAFRGVDDASGGIPPTPESSAPQSNHNPPSAHVQQTFFAADGSAGSVLLHEEPAPTISLAITTNNETLSNRRPIRSGRPLSVLSAATEVPELNVDDELAYEDEYATPFSRQLRVTTKADKKKKLYISAKKQVDARNALIKDYEQVSNDIRAYMATHIYSQKLARFGSIVDNSLLTLRNPTAQILNRVFYEQEKYEKRTIVKRKHEEREAARKKRREERAARKRPAEATSSDAGTFKRRLVETVRDNFGMEPTESEDEDAFAGLFDYEPAEEYNPATQIDLHISEEIQNNRRSESPMSEVAIFPDESDDSHERVLGDVAELVESPRDFSNDHHRMVEDLYDLENFSKIWRQIPVESMTDDQFLCFNVWKFWKEDLEDKRECKNQIKCWIDHVLGQIDEDAAHPSFEVHEYGKRIMHSFGPEMPMGKVIKLQHVLAGSPKYARSRYLFAALILANCGNVEIRVNKGDRKVRHMQLELLSTDMHHEVFASEEALFH